MNFTNIISGVKNGAGRAFITVKKYSPEILLGVGIVGMVTSTVLACKATIKAKEIKDEAEKSLKEIADLEADESMADKYSPEDAETDRRNVAIQTVVKIGKCYIVPSLIYAFSLGALLLSRNILSDRAAEAIASANTAITALNLLNAKNEDKNGQEAADELKYGLTKVNNVDPESYSETDGTGQIKNTEELCAEIDGCTPYARFIDRECGTWDKSSDLMLMSVKSIESEFNTKLVARRSGNRPGYVFLSEVFERLKIPRNRWPNNAAMLGWLYDPNDPTLHNNIDFGQLYLVTKIGNACSDLVLDEYENAILVDFNIDGIIFDRI